MFITYLTDIETMTVKTDFNCVNCDDTVIYFSNEHHDGYHTEYVRCHKCGYSDQARIYDGNILNCEVVT